MVHFVGAGCGAADLITVRGQRLLKEADVIIYAGSLINPDLLLSAKKDCILHDSAKMTLDEIIDVIGKAEEEGLTTVRLHSGEPSLYGAVKEQMDALKERGIAYDSCPGVTAAFGAAASLNLEYTLPDVTQTLILTRMAGRTAVPEKERIASLAAHGASMAIYLSSGLTKEVQEELLQGGYAKDTPAAIVYKATWPEEEVYPCTVSTLHETAERNGIHKTAILLVGDAVQPGAYAKSKLYDANYSTKYRDVTNDITFISFTQAGASLSVRLKQLLESDTVGKEESNSAIRLYTKCSAELPAELREEINVLSSSVQDFAREVMRQHHALVFIGATGIAVRAIADSVKDKLSDAPVLVLDEQGRFVIPLLSGHVGGANALSKRIADLLHAQSVITTATDLNDKFAVDLFAQENLLSIRNKEGIAAVSAKVLRGETIRIAVDERRVWGEPPKGVVLADLYAVRAAQILPDKEKDASKTTAADVVIEERADTDDADAPADKEIRAKLTLHPKPYVLGIGCKKGTDAGNLEAFIEETLTDLEISVDEVCVVTSIDIKAREDAILSFCKKHRIPFRTFSAERLNEVTGSFSASLFVKERTGTDNVCERASKAFCEDLEEDGTFILPKLSRDGMTLAVARREWTVRF